VLLEASDTLCGVDRIEYSINGGLLTLYSTPLIFTEAGPYTITYRACDKAGNMSNFGATRIELGLKGYWSFEDNANNQSGNSGNGFLVKGASYTSEGKIGKAVNFKGNGYVAISNPSYFNNLTSFTLSAWICPKVFNWSNMIISKVTPNRDFVFQISNGKLNAHIAHGATYFHCTADNPVPLNTWTHVAAVWNGSKWSLYQNGNLIKEAVFTASAAPYWTGTIMGIGSMIRSYFFNGKIDEVKIFAGELTADQVKTEWAAGNAEAP
jgi:hypothetical protein